MGGDQAEQRQLDAAAKELSERPQPPFEEVKALAKALQGKGMFGVARGLLASAREKGGTEPWLRQQAAVSTYKDEALPVGQALTRAWEILAGERGDELATDPESLAIAGAIFKRRWQHEADVRHLVRSLEYYERGHQPKELVDCGYAGINAAFLLDVLADIEETDAKRSGGSSKSAAGRREEADDIRVALIRELSKRIEAGDKKCNAQNYWALATLGEAHFGRCEYPAAGHWLRQAARAEPDPWKRQSTAQQLATLARLRPPPGASFKDSDAARVLTEFLGGDAEGVYNAYRGKVGLALSGGGFRASFFHIGVLAHLAEMDMLRHVEVLSCVSGGSIVGVHYYLELQRVLDRTAEGALNPEDYVELVERVRENFLKGVQKNIRMRVVVNPFVNLGMAFLPCITRTRRAGELFEKHLYSKIGGASQKTGRKLSGLRVRPKGDPDRAHFNPRKDNWRRTCKVPILVVNATTLNTGHDWQFTATWMGEPPSGIDEGVDATFRLRRMYYTEAPGSYEDMKLSDGVAASAAVPGLFDPLEAKGLYDHTNVLLVDGGVHDNQGVASLIEQDCNVVLVSDASGQMEGRDKPKAGELGVLLRSNSILMSRVREAQYRDLVARRSSGLVRDVMFLHLHKDLDTPARSWHGEPPLPAIEEGKPRAASGPNTPYGIRRDMQQALAAIRTDLDAFCDVEANALMTSGYKMAATEFPSCLPDFVVEPTRPEQPWSFLVVEQRISGDVAGSDRVLSILKAGKKRFFKLTRRFKLLLAIDIVLLIALAFVAGYFVIKFWDTPLLTTGGATKLIGGLILVSVFGKVAEWILRAVNANGTLIKIASGIALAFGGALLAAVAIGLSKIYLRVGKT